MSLALLVSSALALALAGGRPMAAAASGAKAADTHAGMAMGAGEAHRRAPSLTLALAPDGPITPGRAQAVALTLTDIASGKALGPDDLALAHTERLHLLVVDGSLTDYQHIHPVPDPARPGRWRFDFTPRFGRPYKVWADATLPDGRQDYVGAALVAGTGKAPAPSTATAMAAEKDGLAFSLSFAGPLKAGRAAGGRIAVVDRKTGKPFAGLEPLMGAFAHIVAFAGDWDAIEHVHPLGAEPRTRSERGGPAIAFHIRPERAGALKLFAQIRAGGRETIVPFTATVAP